MDGCFNRFLPSVNAVPVTPLELYTHHYDWLDDLPYDSLRQILLHTSE